MNFPGDRIPVSASQAASVDAYLEYRRIVGDDDGGKLFIPEEYEAYKKKVLPMRMKNRLYVSFTNKSGMDCKLVGPETLCFCNHRYKQHQTDLRQIPENRPILLPCKVSKCPCTSYHYVPKNGSQPIRCTCKHFSDEHSAKRPYSCQKEGCSKCNGFCSHFTCSCGTSVHEHQTIIETKEERQARGCPVGYDNPYQAMGGITGFSSLAEGYQRLDPSGVGAPDEEFLSQPITASDHPFLRANLPQFSKQPSSSKQLAAAEEAELAEAMSALKKPGESDMDYYERRYQQRLKEEKAASRARVQAARSGKSKSRIGQSK